MSQHRACTLIVPVPPETVDEILTAEKLPPWSEDWGKPVTTWLYQTANGKPFGFVVRFEKTSEDGSIEKNIVPLTYARDLRGRAHWHWKGFPEPRPLYNLERLANNPGATIIVVEGEKCASTLQDLLDAANITSHLAVTWPGGANKSAIAKTDWAPIAGRDVVVFPDNDDPSFKAATQIARVLESAQYPAIIRSVKLVQPETDWPDGHDVADIVAAGWGVLRILEFISARGVLIDSFEVFQRGRFGETGRDSAEVGESAREKRSQAEVLIAIARARVELFHDGDTAYALMVVDAHKEVWALKSRGFRTWLYRMYFEEEEKAANGEAISSALNTLEGFARFGTKSTPSAEHVVSLRIAELAGKIYLDLCDATWRIVEIDAEGWRVVENPADRGIYFRRSRGMKALPVPETGGSLATLRKFINFATGDDFILIAAWLIGAFHPRGPYPILALNGEHGSAKTSAARYLRRLIDPNVSTARTAPKKEEDILIAAINSWIVSFDNLSFISQALSDALCRLSTGGGLGKRELYTDADECILDARRPQILTSIEEVAKSGDLVDRLILSTLDKVDDQKRRAEDELDREFDAELPRMLGALLDAVSCALRNIATVKLDRLPRMADFAKWVVAAETACPWNPGGFLRAYTQNRESANQTTLEASSIYEPLIAVSNFHGTATELLVQLTSKLADGAPKPKGWPANPQALSGALRRIAPALRSLGIEVTFARTIDERRTRTITIEHPASDKSDNSASDASAASEGADNGLKMNEIFPSGGRKADASGRNPVDRASRKKINQTAEGFA